MNKKTVLYDASAICILIALWTIVLWKMQGDWGTVIEPLVATYFLWFVVVFIIAWWTKHKEGCVFSRAFLWTTRIIFCIPFFLLLVSFIMVIIIELTH